MKKKNFGGSLLNQIRNYNCCCLFPSILSYHLWLIFVGFLLQNEKNGLFLKALFVATFMEVNWNIVTVTLSMIKTISFKMVSTCAARIFSQNILKYRFHLKVAKF